MDPDQDDTVPSTGNEPETYQQTPSRVVATSQLLRSPGADVVQSTPQPLREREVVSSATRVRADLGRQTTTSALNTLRTTEFLNAGRNGNQMIVVSTPMTDTYSPQNPRVPGSGASTQLQAPRTNIADKLRGLRDLDQAFGDIPDPAMDEDYDNVGGDGLVAQPETRIWGTDIIVQNCVNVFRSFLTFYTPTSTSTTASSTEPLYRTLLLQLLMQQQCVLNLDCAHLQDFPGTRTLHAQLLHFPQEIIPILDHVAHDCLCAWAPQGPEEVALRLRGGRLQVRPFHLPTLSRLRALDPEHIETLVAVKGMVIRVSNVVPDLKQAFFRCSLCHHSLDVTIDRGVIAEPQSCPACQALGSLQIVHNRCLFADKQLVRLQERPDEVPEGETPHTVTVFAFDDLVDALRPGDRVNITGILRAVPRRHSQKARSVHAVFKTYLDAIHFERSSSHQEEPDEEVDGVREQKERDHEGVDDEDNDEDGEDEEDEENYTPQQQQALDDFLLPKALLQRKKVRQFQVFASRPDVYDVLLRSFAPSVYGLQDVKEGLLSLLFGGTYQLPAPSTNNGNDNANNSHVQKTQHMHQRGDINILLCGDPGTSKSQLLSYVHTLASRGVYTSGRGSSAVGLTASVVRDPETRDTVLESGALVLSDRGVCCIDEFDKMSEGARAVLHEALEQQSVSVTKAGVVATLHARTAVLASANPAQSRYNPRLSVVENIQLPPTLLSRFDLIFLVLDTPNAEHDRRLAQHLVSLYYDLDDSVETRRGKAKPKSGGLLDDDVAEESQHSVATSSTISQRFLRDFITYARAVCKPQLGSLEVQQLLVQHYLDMRHAQQQGRGAGSAKTISATPRQLESLIRLSQARAKMRLSAVVTAEDVRCAARLMKVATQSAATDPRTGLIDMDLLTTGRSQAHKDALEGLKDRLLEVLGLTDQNASNQNGGGGEGGGTLRHYKIAQLQKLLSNHMHNNSSHHDANNHRTYVSASEVEEAVRALESEGGVQISYVPRTQTVLVRGGTGGGRY